MLGVLVPAAAAVITLTPGAAAEAEHRFGRPAEVLPHPTLLPDDELGTDVPRDPGLVTVHLKSLRGNLQDPGAVVRAAARGAQFAGGRVRVDLHPEVTEDARLAELLGPGGRRSRVLGPSRFSDAELERYLRQAAVTVLPHRWGTHSGWLELARDLGTRVVAPDCGYYAEQWDEVFGYGNNEETGLDADSLAWAVEMALMQPMLDPADRAARRAERDQVRRAHADLYRRVVEWPRRWLTARCCTWSSDPRSTGWCGTPSVWPSGGHPVLRAERPEEVDPHRLTQAAVVHLPFTERLFAPRPRPRPPRTSPWSRRPWRPGLGSRSRCMICRAAPRRCRSGAGPSTTESSRRRVASW